MRRTLLAALMVFLGCEPAAVNPADAGQHQELDAGATTDSGMNEVDAGTPDAGTPDAGSPDAGSPDAGAPDAGNPDAGAPDAGPRTPPPLPTYAGTCPTLVAGSTQAMGRNQNFLTAGDSREFYVLIPPNYTATKRYPVVFGYHWLNASAGSVIRDAELEEAVRQYEFIAVVPENLMNGSQKAYSFDWPFVETMSAPKELQLFDDVLACLNEQFSVDPLRVHVFGASAGGLWTTYLSTTPSVDRVASVLTISGGLGEVALGVTWRIPWVAQPNKFPAMVVWGGPTDWLAVNFDEASRRYRDALRGDGHPVVTCVHSAGHGIPPFPAQADGGLKFAGFWDFFRDHPYGVPAGTTPYSAGLPSSLPSYCQLVP